MEEKYGQKPELTKEPLFILNWEFMKRETEIRHLANRNSNQRYLIVAVIVFFFAQCLHLPARAQTAPFQIAIEPFSIDGLEGLQAFAFGQHDGKWLLLGGRLDGLHRRQPWATFDSAGQNTQLIVVDPVAQLKWSAPLSSLPVSISEQLSSTNMEFYQDGIYLYVIGGYGYSITADDHITHPVITAVKVPDVITAIIAGTSFTPFFRQVTDEQFAVTGGYLNKIYNIFYLTGGQRFDGRYNPMNNPTFTQEYTNSIRKFLISDDGTNLTVTHLATITDTINLHRRDYNVAPQIMPNGQEGLTAFSGVFQVDADLPFLDCVNIDSTGYAVNSTFSQYYNHYHCANIPLFGANANEMHNLFFGGIAQYYDSAGILVQDTNVPFVRTIARVTRTADGNMAEYKLPVEMPGLLGAGSEFIRAENLPAFDNEVLKLDEITADTTLLGYIFGGINSSEANIFWTNTGTQSIASNTVFRVFLLKNQPTGAGDWLNVQSKGTLHMQVYPNPTDGNFNIRFDLGTLTQVRLTISDVNGKIFENSVLNNVTPGGNTVMRNLKNFSGGSGCLITLETPTEKATQKIIIEQ
jgi:hypothetical protein